MAEANTPRTGVFITLEGIDGSGKSTQAARLVDWLTKLGVAVVRTREPGGTPLGVELRRLLLESRREHGHTRVGSAAVSAGGAADDTDGRAPSPVTEMLLLAADRAQHVARVIKPALAGGKVVVSDRYVDSSLAYQAAALGLSEEDVRLVNDVATGGLRPHLTILLDMDPARAYVREGEGPDRIEQRGVEFQRRVRAAYHELVQREPHRWVVLDVAGRSVDEVHALIVRTVQERLGIGALPGDRHAGRDAGETGSGR